MRLFVALEIPEAVRREVGRRGAGLRELYLRRVLRQYSARGLQHRHRECGDRAVCGLTDVERDEAGQGKRSRRSHCLLAASCVSWFICKQATVALPTAVSPSISPLEAVAWKCFSHGS